MPADLDIRHNPQASRFEVEVEGRIARCDYRMHDDIMLLVHTEVPPALEGRGIGAALVRAALDHAAAAGLRVRPRCSFVAAYFARHPEYHHLAGWRAPRRAASALSKF
jgi:predicted GNAT family acetyltransferase